MTTGRGKSIRQLIAYLWQRGYIRGRGDTFSSSAPSTPPSKKSHPPILLTSIGKSWIVGRLNSDDSVQWQDFHAFPVFLDQPLDYFLLERPDFRSGWVYCRDGTAWRVEGLFSEANSPPTIRFDAYAPARMNRPSRQRGLR